MFHQDCRNKTTKHFNRSEFILFEIVVKFVIFHLISPNKATSIILVAASAHYWQEIHIAGYFCFVNFYRFEVFWTVSIYVSFTVSDNLSLNSMGKKYIFLQVLKIKPQAPQKFLLYTILDNLPKIHLVSQSHSCNPHQSFHTNHKFCSNIGKALQLEHSFPHSISQQVQN